MSRSHKSCACIDRDRAIFGPRRRAAKCRLKDVPTCMSSRRKLWLAAPENGSHSPSKVRLKVSATETQQNITFCTIFIADRHMNTSIRSAFSRKTQVTKLKCSRAHSKWSSGDVVRRSRDAHRRSQSKMGPPRPEGDAANKRLSLPKKENC